MGKKRKGGPDIPSWMVASKTAGGFWRVNATGDLHNSNALLPAGPVGVRLGTRSGAEQVPIAGDVASGSNNPLYR